MSSQTAGDMQACMSLSITIYSRNTPLTSQPRRHQRHLAKGKVKLTPNMSCRHRQPPPITDCTRPTLHSTTAANNGQDTTHTTQHRNAS